ncbi:MAG: hypothetical protein HY908_13780 [Myxococcales bacterium]|nr:hypothetical protein [Myxococcales bacterium]
MATTRPLLALRELTKLDALEDARAAEPILASFGDAPSLWVEATREVRDWLELARRTGLGERAEAVERQADQARRLHEEDARLLAAGDDDAIAKASAARPGDQELALAVARRLRQEGDARGAADLLGKLGAPGALTAAAQEALAAALADAGELGRADDILGALCDERLPAFQEAQAAYAAASTAARQRIAARLQSDQPPADLERQLRGVTDEAKQRQIVIAWMSAEIDHDPAVVRAASEYERQGAAVSATLAHGMLKLRRAAGARGAERTQHLAAAERAFLAIRAEAAGDPSYRLALAQVYHRLGKIDEAERELAEVLALDEPTLTLLVARTYRELGLTSRAREVAKSSYDALTDPKARYAAADLLAHMAPSLEETEAWLRKDDPASPTVQTELESAEATRLMRQGRLAEADKKFARASEYYAAGAKHDATSANNAAMGLLGRYAATGDVGHVRAAVTQLEHGASLAPDNGLVHANLVQALELDALLTALGRYIDVRAVAPGSEALRHFVGNSLRLPLGRDLVAALQKQPAFVRALDVSRKLETLSPNAPDSYDFGGRAYAWTGDAESLAQTYERVSMLPDLAADTNADLEREWLSGERDAEARAAIEASVAAARRASERVQSGGSRPTRAFAATMLAEALEEALYFEPSDANVNAMLGAARQARELWPEGTPACALASSLFEAAFVAALGQSPALARAWQSGRRTTGPLQVAFEASTGPDGAEVTTALRAEPTFAEAVALRRQGLGGRADLWDYLFARLAGDAELEREAAQAFERREVELGHAIGAKLHSGRPEAQRLLALVRNRGAARPP